MPIPFLAPLLTLGGSALAGYAGSKLAGGSSSRGSRGGRGTSTPGGGSLQRVSTLTRPQTELQNRVINEGLRNLGLLTGGGQNLQAPSLPNIPPVPQLTANTPGYGALQQLYQGDKYGFEPIAEQARYRFATQTAPSITERFASLGALSSGAYNRQLAEARNELELGLSALQSQYGAQERGQTFQERAQQNAQQLTRDELLNRLGLMTNEQRLARQQQQAQQALGLGGLANQRFAAQGTYNLGRMTGLQNLLSLGLQPSFNTLQFPRQQGFGESLASPLLQGLGYGATNLLGSYLFGG